MAESNDHRRYILLIKDYLKDIILEDEQSYLEIDLPESIRPKKVINNYIPDLFFRDNSRMIIGEAKTEWDFETRHSIQQYESYITECKLFEGEAIFIVCVSIFSYASIKNILRNMKNKQGFNGKIIVIDEYKRVSEI